MATQASQHCGMLSIRRFKSSADNCSYSSQKSILGLEVSSVEAGGLQLIFLSITGMLYRVHIWGHRWPVHALDIFPLKIVVHQVGSMWTCIIVHKNEVWINCTSEKSHMWFQYLISLPPSKMCRSGNPLNIMPAHTSTPPPPNGQFSTMFLGWNQVPRSLQIIMWQESLFILNLDSANRTFLHSFKVQCWRCWLHCKLDCICTRVSGTHTAGHLA